MCRGHFCAAGDILFRRGTSRACGDGIAVPDGVERPRPEGHAPGRKDTHPAAWNVVPDRWGPQCQMHLRTPWDVKGC